MTSQQTRIFLAAAAVLAVALTQGQSLAGGGHGHGAHDDDHHEPPKGPHGGRLLSHDDGFSLEVTIYEPGIPPQSRVYAFKDDKPIDPSAVKLTMELHRFDRVDTLSYSKRGDFLYGDQIVAEPHSFAAVVHATYEGKDYHWKYESHEGRVEISADSAELSGIQLATAEPRQLRERIPVLGQVGFNQDTVKHVGARYRGVVQSLRKSIGHYVRKGETLAVVLGTDSFAEYSVQSPGSGYVVEKHVTVGEVVGAGDVMFVVADLSTVWVDFTVYRRDATRVAAKQPVVIMPGDDMEALPGKLAYLAPVGDSPSQSVTARAFVRNPNGNLRPGLFVKGQIEVATVDAPVVVRREAIQTFRDWQVVFRNRGTLYEIAIVELGLVDGEFVQVLSGLKAGDSYVAKNSFIVKADIGKAGASHDH